MRGDGGAPAPPAKRAHAGRVPNCLMVGCGEYTTGYAGDGAADSDKSCGVVALVCLDLVRRGLLGPQLAMCGTNGAKMPAVREHMRRAIGDVFEGLDPAVIKTWPSDDVVDRQAYKMAANHFEPGDVAIIFTPDDTHLEIAEYCMRKGMHVLVTKPPVKTLADHRQLARTADECGVLCAVELHKRFDPIYADAADRIQSLGSLSYFSSYMSQPVHQLQTFKRWAGVDSDISYYLNSHHVDFHVWATRGRARPAAVVALHSSGVAEGALGGRAGVEDTITLAVRWRNRASGGGGAEGGDDATSEPKAGGRGGTGGVDAGRARGSFTGAGSSEGHATYTASWVAPKSDVHSQQRWFYLGSGGEVSVDQAHRGYTVASHGAGLASVNPLFWKPTPTAGRFAGQGCYGYLSFSRFVEAVTEIARGAATPRDFDASLATLRKTVASTAILEAGRRSLDAGGAEVALAYADEFSDEPIGFA